MTRGNGRVLRFAVLGRVEVRDGERVVDLGPARRVGVLAALLVDAGRVVPFDVLAERVWDGRPPASAVGTLQAHVSRLRAALGDSSVLRTTPAGYLLDVPEDAVDARDFVHRVSAADTLARQGEREAARAQLDAALALWRGHPYADVVTDFVAVEAGRLDDLRLSAHELAAELDVEAGAAAAVADRLGPLVLAHPFRERLRAALVAALARTGRRAEALACLRDGRRVLAEELGVEPGERLRELQARILAEGADDQEATSPPAGTAATSDPLIGRADELSAAVAACRTAAGGTTQFVALRGEAGIGKTRLAEEVAVRAAGEGQLVAWGRCWQHEGSPALWPWIEALRELDAATPPAAMAAAVTGRGRPLAAVLPELGDPDGSPVDADVAEVRVFDALLHVLACLCGRHPVLVVIDDAQWADPWSRRFLDYLAGHARDLALTVLVTVRSTGFERDSGLAVLAALSRSGRLVPVEISGLAIDEVAALAAARSGVLLGPEARVLLHARTDGNPFYVGEITRLVGDGDPREGGVPDTVRGVVGQRLAALPTADVDVLAVGAVVGRTFDVDLVAAVSDTDVDVVDAVVDRATRAGILRDEPTDEGDLRFAHALLAETLLDEIGPARRRRLHRRVGATLVEQRRAPAGGRPSADRIAHHYLAAGGDADRRTAAALLLEAADDALRRRSVLEVERLLGRAASAADGIGADAQALQQAVRARQVAFDTVVRGPADSGPGVGLGVAAPDQLDAADLLTVLYAQWTWPTARGRMHTATRLSDDLGRLAVERDDDLLRLSAAVMRGCDRFLCGRLEESRSSAAEADGLLARIGVPPRIFTPHPAITNVVWQANSLLLMGRRADARALYAQLRERARSSGDVNAVSAALLDLYDVFWWTFQDEPAEVPAAVARVREAVERSGMTSLTYFVAMPEAWAVSHHDGPAGAALARAAAEVIDEPEGLTYRPFFRGLHADVLLRAGEPATALAALDAGLRESASTGGALWDAELHRLRARARAALDGDAAADVARARAVAHEQGAVLFLERLAADEARD